jgi:hypothetical protein
LIAGIAELLPLLVLPARPQDRFDLNATITIFAVTITMNLNRLMRC